MSAQQAAALSDAHRAANACLLLMCSFVASGGSSLVLQTKPLEAWGTRTVSHQPPFQNLFSGARPRVKPPVRTGEHPTRVLAASHRDPVMHLPSLHTLCGTWSELYASCG